jgi:hypothetical protein
MDKLSECTPFCFGYWLFVPVYLVCYILFAEKGSDPLGRFGYSTEEGVAKYD